ncbi:MAG: ABC transporter ATP-binding protein [Candidatus Caldarchaeum sp.]|uniref:ABC transporter ATP-binding protein n=1 Tax=Caldiarchaeum subterraneum TaxID=311458 RepID=A0A7C4DZA7_CALS0|nr:ABC transporter ATP-binding protein [Candidatus Caldarchaeales archaeon]MDJ0272609.1 ABC transporter ATP-binding protein [Candidatus Caldarchaeales archaeon]
MTALIKCVEVTKYFGGLPALKNINLEIEANEIRAIIGPNGAGKTTLFNVVNGVYKPSSGKIFFDGKDITGKPPHEIFKLGISRTLQIPRPFKDLTVWENVLAGGLFTERLDRTELEKNVSTLLDKLGLAEKSEMKAGLLNLQERKKVELARALASKPKVLMVDEYMSGLNTAEVEEAVQLFKDLRREYGLTIVWVEHVISAVASLADKVTVLNQGSKLAEGRPEEVVMDQEVVEAYLGEREVAESSSA